MSVIINYFKLYNLFLGIVPTLYNENALHLGLSDDNPFNPAFNSRAISLRHRCTHKDTNALIHIYVYRWTHESHIYPSGFLSCISHIYTCIPKKLGIFIHFSITSSTNFYKFPYERPKVIQTIIYSTS